MAATSFHLFPLLPFELQDEIWKLAAMDCYRLVHFFTLYDRGNADQWAKFGERDILYTEEPEQEEQEEPEDKWPTRLAVADFRSSTPYTHIERTLQKPSDRVVEGNLWTVCKRSRWAMSQYGEKNRFSLSWDRGSSPYTVLGSIESNGGTTYLSVRYFSDLLCFRVLDFGSLPWYDIYHPFEYSDERPEPYPWTLQHVAIEFDGSWNAMFDNAALHSKQDKAVYQCLADLTCWRYRPSCMFWFIDYTIRRRPGTPRTSTRGQVFCCPAGRFVEVYWGDPEWDNGEASVHLFASQLGDKDTMLKTSDKIGLFYASTDEKECISPFDRPIADYRNLPEWLGVLAFEEFA